MSNLEELLPIERAALDAVSLPVSLTVLQKQVTQNHTLRVKKFKHQLKLAASAKAVKDWFDSEGQAALEEHDVTWSVGDLSEKVFRYSRSSKFLQKLVRAAKIAATIEDAEARFIIDADAAEKSLSINNFLKWESSGLEPVANPDDVAAEPDPTDVPEEPSVPEDTSTGDTFVTFNWKQWASENNGETEFTNIAVRLDATADQITAVSNVSLEQALEALELLLTELTELAADNAFTNTSET